MVITSNAQNGSLYCNEEERILVGEQANDQFQQTSFYNTNSIDVALDYRNTSPIIKQNDEYSISGIRSRSNTFESQNDSLASTSSAQLSNCASGGCDFDIKSNVMNNEFSSSSTSKNTHNNHKNVNRQCLHKRNKQENDVHGDVNSVELIEEEEIDDEDMDEETILAETALSGGEENCFTNGASQIEKRHKCEICGKAFPYMSILESHKRCHTGEKPFSCHFCDKKFAQKATLQVHERTHTGERPYKCKYCEKTFAQYGTKTVHEKSAHLGIRNYKCPKCDKFLSSPSALYTHKKTHGDKSFQCAFCPKQFTLKNYLKLHVKQVHEHGERKHICKFCSKTFAYAGSLQVHVRTHTGERPYICRFCPKAFASQGNLQSHERTHTGERPYICRYCERSFIQKSQLTAHEATHAYDECILSADTEKIYDENIEENETTISDKPNNNTINSISNYIESENNVKLNYEPHDENCRFEHPIEQFYSKLTEKEKTGIPVILENSSITDSASGSSKDKRQNDFVCKFCGKRYAYASSLYVHTRLHTGERPFRCNFCNKSFTNQGNMQVHIRVHTGEKPYKCEACDKSYAQKVGLKIHQEQCQIYLNRRGSVVTVDSESSPPSSVSLVDSIDVNTINTTTIMDNERILLERILNEKKLITVNAQQSDNYVNTRQNNDFDKATYFNYEHHKNKETLSSLSTTKVIPEICESHSNTNNDTFLKFTLNGDSHFQQLTENTIQDNETTSFMLQRHLPLTQSQSQINTCSFDPHCSNIISASADIQNNQNAFIESGISLISNNSNQLNSNATGIMQSSIDALLKQKTQQQSFINLLLEIEQQQQLQKLSTLKLLLDLSTTATAIDGPQRSQLIAPPVAECDDPTKVGQFQTITPTLINVYNQPSTSSISLPNSQILYSNSQLLSQQLHPQQIFDSQQVLSQLLQLRMIETEQKSQQQQNNTAAQQIFSLLRNSTDNNSSIINDSNNNNITTNNNSVNSTILNVISSTTPISITQPSSTPQLLSYSNFLINKSSDMVNNLQLAENCNNNLNNLASCENGKIMHSSTISLNEPHQSSVIVAAEALRSLSNPHYM